RIQLLLLQAQQQAVLRHAGCVDQRRQRPELFGYVLHQCRRCLGWVVTCTLRQYIRRNERSGLLRPLEFSRSDGHLPSTLMQLLGNRQANAATAARHQCHRHDPRRINHNVRTMTIPCPSCGFTPSKVMRFCPQCGLKTDESLLAAASIPASNANANGAWTTDATEERRKSRKKDKGSATSVEVEVPPAATGEEAAAIYKRMLAAVRGANRNNDEAVAAFKRDCKLYGQGGMKAREFYDHLVSYFGSALMLEHMLPQLVRLIPDDKKRKKVLKVHAKEQQQPQKPQGALGAAPGHRPTRAGSAATLTCAGGANPPPRERTSGSRRPVSANELGRQSSSFSDTGSTGSSGMPPAAPSAMSRLSFNRYADNPRCSICSVEFDIKNRRHRCRKCSASVCNSCSPARMLISPEQVVGDFKDYDPAIPQRVCTICAPLLQCFQDGLNSQYANCHKENPHEAKTRLHMPYSRSLEKECRNAADIIGNFFRPDFGADSDRHIPVAFLKKAHGLAFLTVIKAGLLITAKMGTGIVIAKLPDGSWSAPSAIGTAGIGGGLEAGGEIVEFMIILGSNKAVKVFHSTQVNVGGGLSVAVGPYGRAANAQAAASRGGFNANYSYSHSRGLFVGISLHGAVITARSEMNSNFYGKKLTPEEILSGAIPRPRAAQCLYDAIDNAMAGVAKYDATEEKDRQLKDSCNQCACQKFVAKAFSKKCKTFEARKRRRSRSRSRSRSVDRRRGDSRHASSHSRRHRADTVASGAPPAPAMPMEGIDKEEAERIARIAALAEERAAKRAAERKAQQQQEEASKSDGAAATGDATNDASNGGVKRKLPTKLGSDAAEEDTNAAPKVVFLTKEQRQQEALARLAKKREEMERQRKEAEEARRQFLQRTRDRERESHNTRAQANSNARSGGSARGGANDRSGRGGRNNSRNAKESPQKSALTNEEKELQAIKDQYLGKKAPKKKVVKASEKFAKIFQFDWDASEDTSKDLNPLYAKRVDVNLMYGRGYRAGVDMREQRKVNTFLTELAVKRQRELRLADEMNENLTKEELAERQREREAALQSMQDRERTLMKEMAAQEAETMGLHWSEKALDQMKERDWRIFREDFDISIKGGRAPNPLRKWEEATDLPEAVFKAIRELGFERPSPIQMQGIPIGMQRRDIIGIAETGSGKTAAFVIPMIAYLYGLPPTMISRAGEQGPLALVMAPTRELALQIEQEAMKLCKYTSIGMPDKEHPIRTLSVVGGQSIEDQAFKLREGVDIIIGTPGRLMDCLESHYLVLNQCNYVVLDEADRMIDMGFEPQVVAVLENMGSLLKSENEEEMEQQISLATSGKDHRFRVTTMFSATMPAEVERLAKTFLRHPAIVKIGDEDSGKNKRIDQRVMFIKGGKKRAKLIELLRDILSGQPKSRKEKLVDGQKVIVFVNIKKECDSVAKLVSSEGFRSTILHGGKSQDQREESLKGFREGYCDVLVATDVAGRGLDIPDVTHVINFDLPSKIQNYCHRIGRTGRAGKDGVAISLLTDEDEEIMYDLKQYLIATDMPVPQELANHPSAKAAYGARDEKGNVIAKSKLNDTALVLVGTYSRKEPFVDGQGKGVYVYQLNKRDGSLELRCVKDNVGINPSFVCGPRTSPAAWKQRSVYAVNECDEPLTGAASADQQTGYVVAFSLAADGTLQELNRQETRGTFPCHVSVDPAQHVAVVSNYGGGSVIAFPLNDDGSLAPAADHVQYDGASRANPERQEAAHVHSTTWAPGSPFVFAADLGNDRVAQLKWDATTKRLVKNATSPFAVRPAGAGPRHMAFHPTHAVAYVLDELSNTIGVHPYDATTGTMAPSVQDMSTLPGDFKDFSLSADIHVSTCGQFLYSSNRGHDSIACFRIHASPDNKRGQLELLGWESSRGKVPRGFRVVGDLVIVANQDTHNIEVFRVDPSTGVLKYTGQSTKCPSPVSLAKVIDRLAMAPRVVERPIWSKQVNDERRLDVSEDQLTAFMPSQSFRRDFLALCKLQNVIPHPRLLPPHPEEEEYSSEAHAHGGAPQYDLSDVEQITVKHWQLDQGVLNALCWTLPHAGKVHSLCLFNTQLTHAQLQQLCHIVPQTQLRVLHLEWNALEGSGIMPESSADPPKESPDTVFAGLLDETSPLTFLSLRANGISASGAQAMAKRLRANKTIQSLNLFQNNLEDDGAIALAHALPFNTSLKTVSFANNGITGKAALVLAQALTKYPAPPALLKEIEDAESRIQAELDQAKKAKKKMDRHTAMANLGVPELETIQGVQYAPGNSSLQDVVLSGNNIDITDIIAMSEQLDAYKTKLDGHLRRIKLQRIPAVRQVLYQQKLSEFLQF
ncbi:TPA: hypothetical protein N0F65_010448, partial [Lagenidium giganteum]